MRISDYLPSELEGQKGDSILETCQLTAMLVSSVPRVSPRESLLVAYCQNHTSNQTAVM